MSDNINFDYKNLSPFKWFVLENFPFIEADFDALTEWQLFCKIGKEINKIIDSQNIVGEQAETLTNAFNNLKNYVDNYFNNLDVQDEINNKLNEMAEDGTLNRIINQEIFGEINNNIDIINSNATIMIGDSYGAGQTVLNGVSTSTIGWCDRLKNMLNLNDSDYFKSVLGKTGFGNGGFNTLLENISENIENKELIKNIIVGGGANDLINNSNEFYNSMKTNISNFISYCKTNFPNAKIYIILMGYVNKLTDEHYVWRFNLQNSVMDIYKNASNEGAICIPYITYCLHDDSLMSSDGVHPLPEGYQKIAQTIFNALNGVNTISSNFSTLAGNKSLCKYSKNEELTDDSFCRIYTSLSNDSIYFNFINSVFIFTTPVSMTNKILNVGKVECNFYKPSLDNALYFTVPLSIRTSEGEIKTSGNITINHNGNIDLYLNNVYSNIVKIETGACSNYIPSYLG